LEYCEPDSQEISLFRRLYLQPLRRLNKDDSVKSNSKYGLTVAISEFTKRKIEELYYPLKNELKVIYPPVDIRYFRNDINNRSSQVVSIGNFELQKDQLSQIKIAAAFPEVKFIITGFANSKSRLNYYRKCLAYLNDHNTKNVELKVNLTLEDLKTLLQQSEYFIHTRKNEHFGISTVEAIAAGCIPLVHNSGGQKEVVPLGLLRFNTIDEAVIKFEKILKIDRTHYVRKLQNYIQRFSEEKFEENLNKLIRPYIT